MKFAIYQNGSNGILNNEGLALHNVMEQTGMLNQLADSPDTAVELTVNYNPSHGFLPDGAETMQDKLLVEKLGIEKREKGTGYFLKFDMHRKEQ